MKQPTLFDFNKLDDESLDFKISKTKRDYGHLLLCRPEIREDFLLAGSHLFRKLIAKNLIELSKGCFQAQEYFTNPVNKQDLEIICELAFIDFKYLQDWIDQILEGAVCFNHRIADDSLKAIYGIAKKRPPFDSSVIEDWGVFYPSDARDKELTRKNLAKLNRQLFSENTK
jgi:hypothetical protein